MPRAKARAKRPARKGTTYARTIRDEDEQCTIWVSWALAGGTAAARLHGIPRRTLYHVVDRVDADPALKARAEALRAKTRDRLQGRFAEVASAALSQLLVKVRAGEVHVSDLAPLAVTMAKGADVYPQEGTGGAPGGGRGRALGLPAVLINDRPDEGADNGGSNGTER